MALSTAEKTAIKRALLFYKAYFKRTHDQYIPSEADLESAFEDGDIGGTSFASKANALQESLTSIIAPPFDSGAIALIEAA